MTRVWSTPGLTRLRRGWWGAAELQRARGQTRTKPGRPSRHARKQQTYDAASVAAFVRDHVDRPAVELEPRRLYTAREIEDLTGVKAATIRSDRTRGRWPAPDDESERAHRWYGATVTRALAGRRGYHKADD
ncbi:MULTISPECIES: helix-turn-helix transcriptional regulator [unclassified Streptomyces]|uniref:helix-turn-helix transcriptional regulator n=1 Tax=unclassified Streptomyces TaxID=2593676 RepID=UPI003D93BAB0